MKKAISRNLQRLFWVLSGIVILPCVFVANTFWDKWIDWMKSDSFKY